MNVINQHWSQQRDLDKESNWFPSVVTATFPIQNLIGCSRRASHVRVPVGQVTNTFRCQCCHDNGCESSWGFLFLRLLTSGLSVHASHFNLLLFWNDQLSIHPSPPLFTWPLLPQRVTCLTEPSRWTRTHSFVRSCSNHRWCSSSRREREVSSSYSAVVLNEDRGRSRTRPQWAAGWLPAAAAQPSTCLHRKCVWACSERLSEREL